MTNEQIVEQIKNGYFVTANLELLYTSNLPLIRQLINQYIRIKPQDEPDLVQEAFLGLVDAVNHYKKDEGVLFMTYAEYWVKQRARAYLNKNKEIRIPPHFKEKINRYKKNVQQLQQIYSRTPSDREIADIMNISLEEIKKIRIWQQDVKSLDDTINCNGDSLSLEEVIADSFNLEESIIDECYADYSQKELWNIIDKYTEPEQQSVIKAVFKENKTFKEISEENQISVDDVRKHKENGLRRLRSAQAMEEIKEKLEILEESSAAYRSGLNTFNCHDFTSSTEYIAIKKVNLERKLDRANKHINSKNV